MKSLTIAAFILIATLATATSGQVKSVAAAQQQSSAPVAPTQNPDAKSDFNQHTEATRFRTGSNSPDKSSSNALPANSKSVSPTQKPVGAAANAPPLAITGARVSSSTVPASASQVYRVGIRDVLDIRLTDNPSRDSTLFTVLEGGMIEYPFASGPIVVAGMTTTEIAVLLRQRIKIFDNPNVAVSVRDYASHAITITGFVAVPGTKSLRREAVPLYTVLAEAVVLPEAARATIIRRGSAPFAVELKDTNVSSTLVVPGDAVKVSGAPGLPAEFFFIGGEIKAPGQKPYHAGLTLTQAILASGGTNTSAGSRVRVSRQGADGRLTTEEYDLRNIQTGQLPDPVIQKGDRIEVSNGN